MLGKDEEKDRPGPDCYSAGGGGRRWRRWVFATMVLSHFMPPPNVHYRYLIVVIVGDGVT